MISSALSDIFCPSPAPLDRTEPSGSQQCIVQNNALIFVPGRKTMSDINLRPSIHVFAFVENCWIRLQSVECLANTVASSTSIHLSNAIQNRKHNYDDQQYVPKFGSAAVDYLQLVEHHATSIKIMIRAGRLHNNSEYFHPPAPVIGSGTLFNKVVSGSQPFHK
eukprot:263850_1